MSGAACLWCAETFVPRVTGGSPQRFCSKDCRQNFNSSCRIWAVQEYKAGRVSIPELRKAPEQRACCVQRDPRLGWPPGIRRPRIAPWRGSGG